MKKNIALIAALVAGAATTASAQQDLTVSATFGYEGVYVFRGSQLAEGIFSPAVDATYGNWYAGLWGAFPTDNVAHDQDEEGYWNELDLYVGYGADLNELISYDLGVTYYMYPSVMDDLINSDPNSTEFYAGATLKTLLSPSAYVYYDIDLDNTTVELSVGHSFNGEALPLMSSLPNADRMSLDLGAYAGYVNFGDRENRIGYDPATGHLGEGNYNYAGATADVVYTFNDTASLSVGVRYATSDEDLMGKYDDLTPSSDKLWFGTSLTVGF